MEDTSELQMEYLSSLSNLNVNSKPLINVLTIVAEENIEHGQVIVDAIVKHITKIPPEVKLPVLYLIDSIVKNVGGQYLTFLSHSIVNIFCDVFQEVNEKIRHKMFSLRQTWADVFPLAKLNELDIKTNALDPGWPIIAKVAPAIHVNQNFFKSKTPDSDVLLDKQRKLLELQKRKLELQLAATMKHIEEQEKQLLANVTPVSSTIVHMDQDNLPAPQTSIEDWSNATFTNCQYLSIDINQPNTETSKAHLEGMQPEPQNTRLRDPRLARQMQFQNSAQRNSFNQRNRTTSLVPGVQRLGAPSSLFVPNQQINSSITNRPNNISNTDDSARLSRSRNRSTPKDLKNRSSSKTSPKSSQKSYSQTKSQLPKSPLTPSKSSKISKTSKSRNYARRNRDASKSLILNKDSGDMPPRKMQPSPPSTTTTRSELTASPIPPLIESSTNNSSPVSSAPFGGVDETHNFKNNVIDTTSKDIDLRLMLSNTGSSPISTTSFGSSISATPTSIEGRKRSEERILENTPVLKKRKADKIDALFGKEDVDLRTQLSQAITPIFPKPIISSSDEKPDWAAIKALTPKPNKSNLDAVRAKLAEGSRLLLNKSSRNKDIDLRRRHIREYVEDSQDGNDATFKMIIASAQAQLDNDKMNLEQYNNLMQQVVQAHTNSKKESQKRKNDSANRIHQLNDNNDIFSSSSSDSNMPMSSRHNKRNRRNNKNGKDRNNGNEDRRNRSDGSKRSRNSKWSAGVAWESNPPQNQPRQFCGVSALQNPWQNSQQVFPNNNADYGQNVVMNKYLLPSIQSSPNLPSAVNERTINIDSIPREIRFYDEVAIAFMKENGGEPKEIGFQSGERRVLVDNKDSIILAFNDSYKSFVIDGITYQIRFGSPIRELYINNIWYECFFGDPPSHIPLDGKVRLFKIDGPSPQVRIGNLRTDLVVGKIDLYIDVTLKVSLYLDAQVQYFDIENQKHTVQFADYFLTALIDGEPLGVEYGGMPKKIKFGGRDHYIRFSVMPDGVVPGMVYIKNMFRTDRHRGMQSPQPVTYTDVVVPHVVPTMNSAINSQGLPTSGVNDFPTTSNGSAKAPSINIDDLFQKLLASGILNSTVNSEIKDKTKEKPKPISLASPESLKQHCIVASEMNLANDDTTQRNESPVPSCLAGPDVQTTSNDFATGIVTSSTGDLNATYESIGNESDLQILVPQIPIVDVEDFEEKPIEIIETSVKIKEEPKDDGYDEDDGFEDIGTFEEATIIEDNSEDGFVPIPTTSIHPSAPAVSTHQTQASMITNLDGRKHCEQRNLEDIPLLKKRKAEEIRTQISQAKESQKRKNDSVSSSSSNSNIPMGSRHNKRIGYTGKAGAAWESNPPQIFNFSPQNQPRQFCGVSALQNPWQNRQQVFPNTFSVMPDGVVHGMVYIKNMFRTDRHRGMQSPQPGTHTDVVVPHVVPTMNSAINFQGLPTSGVNDIPNGSAQALSVNIDLVQKCLASGILNSSEIKDKTKEKPKPISLANPESLKQRQPSQFHVLYSGMQCSNCGFRFLPKQAIEYRQHLDWHFRQNRRDRDSTRRAHSRRWYYNVADWNQYEEIEDLDEREKNWFETQQSEMNLANDDSTQRNESPVPSCIAGPADVDKTCDMCHDQFESFYNEENEEWHLRNAIRVEGRTYHPICFEDCKKTFDDSGIKDSLNDDNAVELSLKMESGDKQIKGILLDDDDDVIMLPQEEPLIIEIPDDDDAPIPTTSNDFATGIVTSSTGDLNAT